MRQSQGEHLKQCPEWGVRLSNLGMLSRKRRTLFWRRKRGAHLRRGINLCKKQRIILLCPS